MADTLTVKPVRVHKWKCPICGAEYKTKLTAQECADVPAIAELSVGDFVVRVSGPEFGWYDGDPAWIDLTNQRPVTEQRKDVLGADLPTYTFLYVVTGVSFVTQSHRAEYHIATSAMTEGSGYRRGHTGRSHFWLKKVDDSLVPEAVKQQAAALLKSLSPYTGTLLR